MSEELIIKKQEWLDNPIKDLSRKNHTEVLDETTMYDEEETEINMNELETFFEEEDKVKSVQAENEEKKALTSPPDNLMNETPHHELVNAKVDLYGFATKAWLSLLNKGFTQDQAKLLVGKLIQESQEAIYKETINEFCKKNDINPSAQEIKRLQALISYDIQEAEAFAKELAAQDKIQKTFIKGQSMIREENKKDFMHKVSGAVNVSDQKDSIYRTAKKKWVQELAQRTGRSPLDQARFLVRNGYV